MQSALRLILVGWIAVLIGGVAVGTAVADPTIAAAGDISKCDNSGDQRTADLIQSLGPDRVLALGDLAYPDGGLWEFLNCYDPTWGAFKWKTLPTPGNHEYLTGWLSGYRPYFDYWADGTWYATDLGSWRIYSLNSERRVQDQVDWLRDDMQSHPRNCYLAFWHRPRYSDGPHGDEWEVEPLWNTFENNGGDVVLSGHDHNYQRWPKIDGVKEFVVGTGGAENSAILRNRAEIANDNSNGVLMMTLHDGGYDYSFKPAAGDVFQDDGSGSCTNG